MKGLFYGVAFSLPLWAAILSTLSGCGMSASFYPVTSAYQETQWDTEEAKCLWGPCPGKQNK